MGWHFTHPPNPQPTVYRMRISPIKGLERHIPLYLFIILLFYYTNTLIIITAYKFLYAYIVYNIRGAGGHGFDAEKSRMLKEKGGGFHPVFVSRSSNLLPLSSAFLPLGFFAKGGKSLRLRHAAFPERPAPR